MGRAAFAVAVAAAVFWLSGRAPAMAAQEPEEGRYGPEIRITRNVEPAEDGEFQDPQTGTGTAMERSTGWIPGR